MDFGGSDIATVLASIADASSKKSLGGLLAVKHKQ
jgi:hypothetical protein